MSQRQGVIFDVEDQAEVLNPLQTNAKYVVNASPFVPTEEETPLQQPRPPERLPRKRLE